MNAKTLLFIISFLFLSINFAHAKESQPVSLPGITVIKATIQQPPPVWAVKQRQLIKIMNEVAPLYLNKFTYAGGTMREHGKLDDDYECFNNWPLFYIIGGDEKIFDWALQEWSAITRQWTYQHQKSVHKEFVKQYDMLHLSEGYVGFQYFGLADPSIPENIDRARRFAGFYMNEDPEVQNYDPVYKIIRSPITGSAGPAFASDANYVLIYGHASLYPIVKHLESGWEKNPKRHEEIQKLYNEMVISGDVPMNLAITGLVTHAFLLTGDEKYKKWILEYVDAWMERTRENNGIIPDNVGLSGKIGEKRDGQWWGGFFGWSGRYSLEMIFNSLITASECAYILSGDPKYLGFLRSQVDMLLDKSIVQNGDLLVPYKMGPAGWYDYRPLGAYIFSHLWHASLDPADWKRTERIRTGRKNGPWEYAYADSPNPPPNPEAEMWKPDGTLFDWNEVLNDLRGNQHRRNEPPHLSYLGGTNPDWPEKILNGEYEHVCRNFERIKKGTYENEWKSQSILLQNPIFTNGLAQMTMGAPFTCFNGGLLRAQVRYFDVDRARPGLPEDVAALVEKIEKECTIVQLVNTGIKETRRLIIQGGAYGEHEFTSTKFQEKSKDDAGNTVQSERNVLINKKYFQVDLPPGTSIKLNIGTRCFVNKPTYAFPWQGEKVASK